MAKRRKVINWRNVAIVIAPQTAVTVALWFAGIGYFGGVLWGFVVGVVWAVISALLGISVREEQQP